MSVFLPSSWNGNGDGMRDVSIFKQAGISVTSTFWPSVISSSRPGSGLRSTGSGISRSIKLQNIHNNNIRKQTQVNRWLSKIENLHFPYLAIALDRGWLIIHARQMGYSAVFSWYLAKSTLRSKSFMMKLWLDCGGGVRSLRGRLGGRPRPGAVSELFRSSPSTTVTMSCRAPFNLPLAATTSVAANIKYKHN